MINPDSGACDYCGDETPARTEMVVIVPIGGDVQQVKSWACLSCRDMVLAGDVGGVRASKVGK